MRRAVARGDVTRYMALRLVTPVTCNILGGLKMPVLASKCNGIVTVTLFLSFLYKSYINIFKSKRKIESVTVT